MLKKALLATAIAASLPMSAMAVGPIDGKIYGKAFVTANSVDYENGDDEWKLVSNASRIGVKGKSELSEGLYAIYKAEFEMFIDDGEKNDDQTFSQRNIYVGLTGDFGTIIAGKHDTPTKLAQKKIDLFNDLEGGDIKNTFEGENRESNIAIYTTPKMGGFAASIGAVASEGDDVDGDGEDDDGFDGTSISLSYSMDNLYLAVAADKDIDGMDSLTRFVGQYNMDALQLGFMYQDSETHGDAEEDGYFVSAAYKIGKAKLKAQYGDLDKENAAGDDSSEKTFSIGLDYKLGKKTKAFAFYTQNEDNGTDDDYFGVGLEHKF